MTNDLETIRRLQFLTTYTEDWAYVEERGLYLMYDQGDTWKTTAIIFAKEDAEFIASCPTFVDELCDEVELLRDRVKELEEEAEQIERAENE